VKAYFNKEGFFRVKPVYNKEVNGYWMCDEGRDLYKFANRDHRYLKAGQKNGSQWSQLTAGAAAKELSGQYTNEEYDKIIGLFANELKTKKIFHWINNKETFESFDGLLLRGDKNPNTKGLLAALAKHGISATWNELESGLTSGAITTVVVAGPENQLHYQDMEEKVKLMNKAKQVIWLQSAKNSALEKLTDSSWIIPMKSYVEKDGTFTNHAGKEQKFKRVTTVVSDSLTLSEAAELLCGHQLMIKPEGNQFVEASRQADKVMLEHRKKNEFVFKRGNL
jgi:NADH-quinone oxidoreductase subunit G